MAKTWGEYAKEKAEKLGACEDDSSFKRVLGEILVELKQNGTPRATLDIFWPNLKVEYQKAPKLMLKEATAAAKLMALKDKADAYISQAQTQSQAQATK